MKITKIESSESLKGKTRAAAYCRVSNPKEAMKKSLASQISEYNAIISLNPDWEFAGIYADDGISGTKEDRREFCEMIEKCRRNEIDLILTKSISRFSRNIIVMLKTVRELSSLGVDVYFEDERIHSLSNDGEMMLTLLAAHAEEQAISVSENLKWRIRHDFEEGKLWGGADCYGYKIVNRKYVTVPEEVELVRRIFGLYIEGNGFNKIMRTLNAEGLKSKCGKEWNSSSIQGIIGNINYTGDLILQKTYRPDPITKRRRINRGERDSYYVENDHEAIISHDVFYKAQAIRARNCEKYKNRESYNGKRYLFSGMIKCGCCGGNYRHKVTKYNELWMCSTFCTKGKDHCQSKQIPEAKLKEALCLALEIDEFSEDIFRNEVKMITAYNGNRLAVELIDGSQKEVVWIDPSRKDSWSSEMKEEARKRSLEISRRKKECQQ